MTNGSLMKVEIFAFFESGRFTQVLLYTYEWTSEIMIPSTEYSICSNRCLALSLEKERKRERDRQTDRQTDRVRQTEAEKERDASFVRAVTACIH